MEAVVAQALVGDAVVVRRADRPAERARVAEAGVVDEHDEDVRSALRWLDVADDPPARRRVGERLPGRPGERRAADGQGGPVDRLVAHVTLLVIVSLSATGRPSASPAANARAWPAKSGLRLVGGIRTPR